MARPKNTAQDAPKDEKGTKTQVKTKKTAERRKTAKKEILPAEYQQTFLPNDEQVNVYDVPSRAEQPQEKMKFYSLNNILSKNCDYNVIFGERSNGKTYAVLEHGIRNYIKTGEQMAYIRRWREDLRGKRAESLFANHVNNGLIEKLTDGKYNEVFYLSGKWFLSFMNTETGKRSPDIQPFCFGFCLSEQEHEKSSSYPNITTVVFDEFLTRRYYLPDEFMLFMNMLSTIIRQRDNVKVFMLGNTVNKFCPYFTEMGLKQVPYMEQGTIDIYRFGEHGATVAVEYTASVVKHKASNKYFCFDNQNLQMITGGKWELAVYPHLPVKYKPQDVLFVYYIKFGDVTLQANIIQVDDRNFTYIHAKTTPIHDTDNSLIYALEMNGKPNYKRRLISTASDVERQVARYFATDSVFYQNNEIGEIVRNYIMVSSKNNIVSKI